MKIKNFLIAGSIFLTLGIILALISISTIGISESKYEKKLIISENTYSTSDITKLNLEIDADTVTLISEDRTDFYIQNKELEDLTYKVEKIDDTLSIIQNRDDVNHFFSLNWAKNKVFTKTPLIIKVPSSLELDYSIQINGGIININQIKGKNIDLNVNAGTISINELSSSKLSLNLNAGALELNSIVSSNIDVKVNAGAATLKNVSASTVDIDVSAGACSYEGIIQSRGNFSIAAGALAITLTDGRENYTVNGSGSGSSLITTSKSAGSLEITYK